MIISYLGESTGPREMYGWVSETESSNNSKHAGNVKVFFSHSFLSFTLTLDGALTFGVFCFGE